MKEPNKDERLSALLEGKVQGEQREELLAHLARNEDDYAVFASTGAVLRALEEEDARAAAAEAQKDVIPLRRPARGPRLPNRVLAMAASIAAVALVSTFALRTRPSPAGAPVLLADRLANEKGLPADWKKGAVGSSSRGGGNADAVSTGASLTDLAVAIVAHDTAEIAAIVAQLRPRTERGASADTPLGHIAENPNAPTDSLNALLEQATDRLARMFDRKPLEFGAWAEAARIAAMARDDAFFRDDATDGMLGRADRIADDNEQARAAVDRVRSILPDGAATQWEELEKSIANMLRELAS
ncbi:MAG TPA: hypothetical protein VF006_06165 [Longimicrobium sp.]